MDMEGLGYKTIDLLLREKLIKDPADIFLLRTDQLLGFEGWGEISVRNLMNGIEAARHRPLRRVLMALGIRHVGGTSARVLAQRYRSLRALMSAPEEEIAATEGVGPVIAASIKEWSNDPDNIGLVAKFEAAGVSLEDESAAGDQARSDLLGGISVVVTGTLASMSREEAEAAVVAAGGKVTSGVSKKTTYLVAGDNPGASKVTKAAEAGVPTIDEAALLRLLQKGAVD
jgi:DNA ligase (NAD+)